MQEYGFGRHDIESPGATESSDGTVSRRTIARVLHLYLPETELEGDLVAAFERQDAPGLGRGRNFKSDLLQQPTDLAHLLGV